MFLLKLSFRCGGSARCAFSLWLKWMTTVSRWRKTSLFSSITCASMPRWRWWRWWETCLTHNQTKPAGRRCFFLSTESNFLSNCMMNEKCLLLLSSTTATFQPTPMRRHWWWNKGRRSSNRCTWPRMRWRERSIRNVCDWKNIWRRLVHFIHIHFHACVSCGQKIGENKCLDWYLLIWEGGNNEIQRQITKWTHSSLLLKPQIQSITDISRGSIRRKNPSASSSAEEGASRAEKPDDEVSAL